MRKEKKHFPNLKMILGLVFIFAFLIFIAPRVLAADCTLVDENSTCPSNAKSVYITGNFSDTVIYPGQSFIATGDKMMVKVTSTSFTVSGATEITYDWIESNGKDVSLSGQKITPDSGSIVTGVPVGQQGDSGDVTITVNEIGSSNDWIGDINTAGFDANAGNVTITAKFINMGNIHAFSECWDINNCQDPYNKTFGNAGQITVNGAVIFLPANLKVHGLQPTSINIEATNVIDAANITTYGGCKQKKVVDGRTFCAECTASGSVTLSASKFVGVSSFINTSSGSAGTGRAGDITISSSGSWTDSTDGEDKAGAEIGRINATGLSAGSVTINGKNVNVSSIDVSSSDPEAFPEEIVGFTGSGAGQVSISASQDLSFTGPIYAIGKYPFAPDGGNVSLTAGRRLGIYSPGGEVDVSSNNLRDKWNFSWGFPWYVINGVTVGVCDGTKPYLSGTNAGVKTDGTDTGHGDGPRGGNGGAITISAKEIPLPNDGSDWITLWLFANGGWGSPGGVGGSATYCEPYAGDKDVMPIHGFGGKGGSGGSGGTINLNISDVSCLSKIDLRAKAGGGGDAGSHGSLPGYSPEYTTREDNKCPLHEWQGKAIQARLMSPEAGIGGIGGIILVRAPQGSYAQDGGPMIIKDAQASVEGGRGGNSVSSNTGPYPFYCTVPRTTGNLATAALNAYQDPNCYDINGNFICDYKIANTPCQSQAFTNIDCQSGHYGQQFCWGYLGDAGISVAQAREGAFSGRNGANGGLAGSIDICTNLIPGGSTCSFSAKGGSGAGGARGQDAFISQPGIGGAGGAGRKGGSIIVPDANSFVNDENITGGIGGDGGEGGQAAMMQLPTADGFCAVIHSGFPTDPASTWDTYFADWGRLCGEGEIYEDGCCYYAGALKSCRTNDSPEYFFGVMSNYTSVTGANGVGNGNDNKGSRSSGPLCVAGLICEPQLIIKPTPPPPNETGCCDGIDNDFDGFLDCQDSDCGSECFDPGGLLIGETVETWQTKCGVVICDDSQNNDPNYDNDIDLDDETNCKKCEDGVLDTGEECDLGSAVPSPSPSPSPIPCTDPKQKCVNCQCINYCGNGRIDSDIGEICDTDANCVSLYGSGWECINPGQPNECQCQEVPNTQPDIDTTTNPPTATQTNQNICSPSPIIKFTWQYEDSDNVPPGADPQSAYEIQIDDDSNVAVSPLMTLSGGSESSREYSGLDFNTQYWWRIRVRDTNGPEWSNWANGNSFTTSSPLPVADFTFTPANPVVGEQVQFTNNTNCPVSPCTYNWTFQDGNPATSILVNPLVTFNSEGQKSVTLIATDSLGRSCNTGTVTKNIPVGLAIPILPNPKWKEILPF